MIRTWNTPALKLAVVMILGLLATLKAVQMSLEQARYGVVLGHGTAIESRHGDMRLEHLDFTIEPGEIETHAELNRFYQRQDQILALLEDPEVRFTSGGQTIVQAPRPRTLSDLPIHFWIPIIVGLGALAISGWIWALRSRDLAASLYALSGLSTFVSAIPSAVYTTRELAIPSKIFWWLETLNAWGASCFGISMIALFMLYPVPLKRWKLFGIGQAVIYLVWTTAYSLQLTPDFANISLIMVSQMVFISVVIAVQFLTTRKNPTARASLLWLGVSVMVGAGAFILSNTVPIIMGWQPLHQGFAFSFLLIIYLGLAAGLTRYKLFEVRHWAFRFLFYAAGALMLGLLDAALILGLGLERIPAMGLALLAVGFLYLPLRDVLWRRLSKRELLEPHEMLAKSLEVAFAPTVRARAERWQTLLRDLYAPLEMEPTDETVREVEIRADGLSLLLPPTASGPALKLDYPWGGRGLFNSNSRATAAQIASLIGQAESNREAYDRGVAEERRRVAQDLHDDIGARLLTGLHLADEKMKPTLQGAIADIRAIVSEMSGDRIPLVRSMMDIRFESIHRLSLSGIEVEWPLAEEADEPEWSFDFRRRKALISATREIVSNVIRHAGATKLRVSFVFGNDALEMSFQDNGNGLNAEALRGDSAGHGLRNLQRRFAELGGEFEVRNVYNGSFLRFKLPRDAP